MKRTLIVFLLVNLMLSACAPVSAPTSTPAPSATPLPTATTAPTSTATPTSTPTAVPTATPTPIPTIQVGSLSVPDPRVTNPELFDVTKKGSPIVEYANAFKLNSADVLAGLHPEVEKPQGMPEFITMRTTDGVALIMATRNENGEWVWQKATPGIYWHAQGKVIGVYLAGDEVNDQKDKLIKYFSYGALGLNGTVRPGPDIIERRPNNASKSFSVAKLGNMGVLFHYVAEPGKFPNYVNKDNVEEWMITRLRETLNVYKTYKPPFIYLEYNEPFSLNSAAWNPEYDPFRERYGNRWMEEYIYLAIKIFSEGGLNKTDFTIVINVDNPFNLSRAKDIHEKIVNARHNAFLKLSQDPLTQIWLTSNNIGTPDNIPILLGAQTSTNEIESDEQIKNLANMYQDLGGIILTEVSIPSDQPYIQQQELEKLLNLLGNEENIRGLLIFNFSAEDNPNAIQTKLFDNEGKPNATFFLY
jgi:hypothetical protein